MKIRLLITILTLISSISYSQRKVTGIVYSKQDNEKLPCVKIQELGTDNFKNSNLDGTFTINTLNDTCTLNFSFVGLAHKNVEITSDTIIDIKLSIWDYRIYWFTFTTNYDLINSCFGFSISNGLDEQPMIFGEDFSSNFIYKIGGQTNFKNDFSYGCQFAWRYSNRWINRTLFEYSKTNFKSINFNYTNFGLSTDFNIPRIYTSFLLKFGYQELNNYNNFGFQIGLEKELKRAYFGIIYGNYFDYPVYKVYLQKFIYKYSISLRIDYERINHFNFVNCGIHFSFNKGRLIE
jgi:hypothetical protein